MQLYDYQKSVVGQLYRRIKEGATDVVLVAPTGSGKCLGKGTPVRMYDGTVKSVENVLIGDLLMGDDSTPRQVLSLARGKEEMFKITPVKGDPWVCNKSHILSLVWNGSDSHRFKKGCVYDISVADYLSLSSTQKHCLKQFRVGVDYPYKYVKIDPYFLGVWLGDGVQKKPAISTVKPELIECVNSQAAMYGLKTRVCVKQFAQNKKASQSQTIYLTGGENGGKKNGFLQDLRFYGLTNQKRIPLDYLANDRSVRISVLAGLLDTDGYYCNGYYEICQVRPELAEDILVLARSLGFAAYCSIKIVNSKPYYRITISGDLDEIPLRVSYKKAAPRRQKKSVLRTGFSVESLGMGDYYGFEIDGNRRFLLGDFTVTHNTILSAKIVSDALSKGRRVIFLVTINCLIDQSIDKFEKFGITDYGVICAGHKETPSANLQIASLQTLGKRQHWLNQHFDIAMFDEAHTSRWFGVADLIQYTWSIGLTATPFRLSKKQGFGDKFGAAVLAPDMPTLTEMGKLAPLRYKGLQSVDTSQIKLIAGDFNEAELSKVCNTSEAIKSALDGWEQFANTKRTIAFSVDVSHGHEIVKGLRDRGYTSEIVTGSTKNRKPIFEAFEGTEIQNLVSCNALSTGFDVPNVECGLMLRPTESIALHLQQIGRAARTSLGKTHGLILDAAGNCDRLGFPEQISAALTEENVLSYGQESLGQAPIKKCPECEELIYASARICPSCGHEFEFEESDREVAVGQFVDLMNPAIVRMGGEAEHAEYYRYLINRLWSQGRCPSTAYADYIKQGFSSFPKPGFRWARGAIYQGDNSDANLLQYFGRVKQWRSLLKKDGKWVDWMVRQEFGSTGVKRLEELGHVIKQSA